MKSQTVKLAEYLNAGGTITREDAWQLFQIQNITARLSELTNLGYSIVKTPCKALVGNHEVRLSAWKLAHTINPGDTVKVIKDIGTLVTLMGRTGRVERVDLKKALATVFLDGIGYRSLRFNALARVEHFTPGTPVRVKPTPLVVLEYFSQANSYSLASPVADHTIVAHASLVEETAPYAASQQ